ncbi:MAG TPA: glycoside hydrolase family 47 protein [Rhizomicrobium sp.]|nr:glycoside hydrolase family 47 protein [Rhizomicrobium sp.]
MRITRRLLLGAPLALAPLRLTTAGEAPSGGRDWTAVAEDVRGEMAWAWKNYVELAFGQDQLKPVSGAAEPFLLKNGPSLGLSLVEALDTLYLMHLDAELEEAVRWIEKNLHFDIDGELQVFETNIRMVGGLLAGWLATHNKTLLSLAHDLAERLLPAFTKSPTGIPYRFVNLKTGAVRDPQTFPAELGTYISEFGTLARATGDQRFYDAAKNAARACFDRRSSLDLVADTIDAETGKWLSRRATVGPPSDSYYEYLYGGWRLFGDTDFKHWYDVHAAAALKHQAETVNGRLWFANVDFETGARIDRHQSELAAFYAGLLAKAGDRAHAGAYLESWAAVQLRFYVLPEGFDYGTFSPTRVTNELRPEFADSCLALFVHGGGERERQLGHLHYLNMKRTSRARFGYTIIDDITTLPMRQGDLCPGYWWAEQMKYYWLLFSDTPRFDYANNYLSTEGKVLAGLR